MNLLPIFQVPARLDAYRQRIDARKRHFQLDLVTHVAAIFERVASEGDDAVRAVAREFDKVDLPEFEIDAKTVDGFVTELSPELRSAIERAAGNIEEVNRLLLRETNWRTEVRKGTFVGEKFYPLDSVAVWAPARKGALISSALMLVVAARVAGVREIVVAGPITANGEIDKATFAAARLAGATRFFRGTGVATTAAFACGTDTIPRVDGIFGPGPAAVSVAMGMASLRGLRSAPGIGPTDCMVIADEQADPKLVAIDLATEAEHGRDSVSVLVTTSDRLASDVQRHFQQVIEEAPEDRRIILKHGAGPEGMSCIAVVDSTSRAIELANEFAPEHLMVVGREELESEVSCGVVKAGELLVGAHTPFAAANYAIGITAVLPTNGFARSMSGITCRDMMRSTMVASLGQEAMQELAGVVETLALNERLPSHAKAAALRAAK